MSGSEKQRFSPFRVRGIMMLGVVGFSNFLVSSTRSGSSRSVRDVIIIARISDCHVYLELTSAGGRENVGAFNTFGLLRRIAFVALNYKSAHVPACQTRDYRYEGNCRNGWKSISKMRS